MVHTKIYLICWFLQFFFFLDELVGFSKVYIIIVVID